MKHRVLVFFLFIVYMSAATALMIWQGIGIAPDRYVLVLLLGSLLVKRTRSFIMDWIPFLFILISYDFLRGFADNLSLYVHYFAPIWADRWIFGFVPTISLQQTFFNINHLNWYDYVATIFYFLHFAIPLSFGYLLWLQHKNYFYQFVVGISLLSYSAWITFLIFPVAPPWMAGEEGHLPGIVKILDSTLASFPTTYELPTIYHRLNPNPVAAVPSLHAAYPFLVLLFCIGFFRLKGLFFLPYTLAVWISMVYLGEHYVIDIIIGAIYALFAYLLTKLIMQYMNWSNIFSQIKNKLPKISN